MPTYRSAVAITTAPLRRIVYRRIADILEHLPTFNVHMTRIQLMPDNFVELDTTGPIPVAQLDHLGLTGPV